MHSNKVPAPAPAAIAADLIAGVSMAGLLPPQAVADAGIAGLPPQAGVPALFAGLLAEMRTRIADRSPRAFVLSLEETPDLDGTTIEALADFTAQQGRAGRVTVLALLQGAMAGQPGTLLEAGSVDDAVASLPGASARPGPPIAMSRGSFH